MWREALGCYKIVTEGKKGYRNHPATKEFINAPGQLWDILEQVRKEMLRRGYHPKELPVRRFRMLENRVTWQSLDQQKEILRMKGCSCVCQ